LEDVSVDYFAGEASSFGFQNNRAVFPDALPRPSAATGTPPQQELSALSPKRNVFDHWCSASTF
jgi:hypothetical protein